MERRLYDFRNALALLKTREEHFAELMGVIDRLDAESIVARQESLARLGRRPRGGQRAINALFRDEFTSLGWISEPALFPADDASLRGWKMDFYKGGIGVEIAFNHAEAIPWIFTRLNIAGESTHVKREHHVEVGVAMFATENLKSWARMDAAVGTFEIAQVWLDEMRPILPVPILVIGLDPGAWASPTRDVFPGTSGS